MYAVIATGGKQYRVAEGDVVRIEKLVAEPGAAVEFDKVLLVGEGDGIKVGAPLRRGRQGVRLPSRRTARATRCGSSSSAAASTTCVRARTGSRIPKSRSPASWAPEPGSEGDTMAHKKAGGSTKNGRDSHSKRLGAEEVRRRAGRWPATSSCASAARSIAPATTSASAPITRCSRCRTGVVQFKRKGVDQRVHVSVEPQG